MMLAQITNQAINVFNHIVMLLGASKSESPSPLRHAQIMQYLGYNPFKNGTK
jgi:hypothetical protein